MLPTKSPLKPMEAQSVESLRSEIDGNTNGSGPDKLLEELEHHEKCAKEKKK